jgi:hypothetical protein
MDLKLSGLDSLMSRWNHFLGSLIVRSI